MGAISGWRAGMAGRGHGPLLQFIGVQAGNLPPLREFVQ